MEGPDEESEGPIPEEPTPGEEPAPDMRGLIPRVLHYIFGQMAAEQEQKHSRVEFVVKCSYLQIYNEHVSDLLDPESQHLNIREDSKRGMYVEGLQEVVVPTAEATYGVFRRGSQNRHVGMTAMNMESSRSHSVFTLVVESQRRNEGGVLNRRTSRFYLVDLAGSERQKHSEAGGVRLKEAGSINKSLSALGNVIKALVDISEGKIRHVPYRDSKLTFLLKDALGGNSKCTLIANISPARKSAEETLSTLKFAQRAKLMCNAAVVNEDMFGNPAVMGEEIRRLRLEIASLRANLGPSSSGEQMMMMMIGDDNSQPGGEGSSTTTRVHRLELIISQSTKRALANERRAADDMQKLLTRARAAESLCDRLEHSLRTQKMIVRLRDSAIKRLDAAMAAAAVAGGGGGGAAGGEHDAQVAELREEVELLQRQVDNHPDLVRFKMELDFCRARIRELESGQSSEEQEALASEAAQLDGLNQALRAELQETHHESRALAGEVADARRANEVAQLKVAALEEHVSKLMETSEACKQEALTARQLQLQAEEKYRSLCIEHEQVQMQSVSNAAIFREQTQINEDLLAELTRESSKGENASCQVEALREKLEQAEKQVAEHQREMADLTSENARLTESASSTVAAHEAALEDLRQQLSALGEASTQALAEARETAQQSEAEAATKQQLAEEELATARVQVAALEEALASAQQAIAAAKEEAIAEGREASRQKEEVCAQRQLAEEELVAARRQVASLEGAASSQRQLAEQELAAAKRQVASLEEAQASEQQKASVAREQAVAKEREARSEELAAARGQVAALEEALASAQRAEQVAREEALAVAVEREAAQVQGAEALAQQHLAEQELAAARGQVAMLEETLASAQLAAAAASEQALTEAREMALQKEAEAASERQLTEEHLEAARGQVAALEEALASARQATAVAREEAIEGGREAARQREAEAVTQQHLTEELAAARGQVASLEEALASAQETGAVSAAPESEAGAVRIQQLAAPEEPAVANGQVAALKEELSNAQQAAAAAEELALRLEERSESQIADLTALEERLKAAKAQKEAAEGGVAAYMEELTAARSALTRTHSEVEHLSAVVRQLAEEKVLGEQGMLALGNQLAEREAVLQEARASCQVANAELERVNAELEKLEMQTRCQASPNVESKKDELASARAELAEASARLRVLEEAARSFETERETLTAVVNAKVERLCELEVVREQLEFALKESMATGGCARCQANTELGVELAQILEERDGLAARIEGLAAVSREAEEELERVKEERKVVEEEQGRERAQGEAERARWREEREVLEAAKCAAEGQIATLTREVEELQATVRQLASDAQQAEDSWQTAEGALEEAMLRIRQLEVEVEVEVEENGQRGGQAAHAGGEGEGEGGGNHQGGGDRRSEGELELLRDQLAEAQACAAERAAEVERLAACQVAKSGEVQSLVRELERLEARVHDAEQALLTVSAEKGRAVGATSAAESRLESLEGQLKSADVARQEAMQRLLGAQAELESERATCHQLSGALSEAQVAAETLAEELNREHATCQALQEQLAGERSHSQELTGEASAARQLAEAAKARASSLEGTLENLKRELQALDCKRADVEGQLGDCEQRGVLLHAELAGAREALQARVAALKEEAEAARRERDRCREEHAGEARDLRGQVAALEEQKKTMATRVASAEEGLAEEQKRVEHAQGVLAGVREEARVACLQREKLAGQLTAAKSTMEALEKELAASQDIRAGLEQQLAEVRVELSQADESWELTEDQRAEAACQLAAVRGRVTELEEELAAVRLEIGGQLAALEEQREALEQRLEEAHKELAGERQVAEMQSAQRDAALQELAGAREALAAERQVAEARREEMEEEREEALRQLQEQQADLEQSTAMAVQSLLGRKAALEKEVQALQARVRSAEGENALLKERAERFEAAAAAECQVLRDQLRAARAAEAQAQAANEKRERSLKREREWELERELERELGRGRGKQEEGQKSEAKEGGAERLSESEPQIPAFKLDPETSAASADLTAGTVPQAAKAAVGNLVPGGSPVLAGKPAPSGSPVGPAAGDFPAPFHEDGGVRKPVGASPAVTRRLKRCQAAGAALPPLSQRSPLGCAPKRIGTPATVGARGLRSPLGRIQPNILEQMRSPPVTGERKRKYNLRHRATEKRTLFSP